MERRADVAVLYARPASVYFHLAHDVYDIERDARTYCGPLPVVAHPPCRAWGRLRGFAKPRSDEKELALHAVECVRTWGGVLEHPAASTLWAVAGLPERGRRDKWGGLTFVVDQGWFGHRAPKRTLLYIVGAEQIPVVPFVLGDAPGRVENMGRSERERTPEGFARWLLDLASGCGRLAGRSGGTQEVHRPRSLGLWSVE